MEKITFLSTNRAKYRSYREQFAKHKIDLELVEDELFEPQSFSPEEIIRSKLKQAKEKVPNKAVLVDDRSLFIPSLNGFPGPALKMCVGSIGSEGLLKLMTGKTNREMNFVTALGFFDGNDDCFFYHSEKGKMARSRKLGNLRGWTEILEIYIPEAGPKKTLSMYTDEEWAEHLAKHDKSKLVLDLINNIEADKIKHGR